MNEYQNLKTELADGMLVVTVSRPESLNALNIQTMNEIRELLQSVYDSPEVKGVIFTGEGEKAFVAGADITEIAELTEVNGRKFAENGHEIFDLIENSEKPMIAAVNGFALGGGCELAMACHIRIAADTAKFGQPEVKLGLIPGYGGTQRLTHLVGKGIAMELMMSGDMISAERAREIGLVNHVVNPEELMETSRKLLNKIIQQAPLAIGMVVDCVNAYYSSEGHGYQTEANSFSNCIKSQDFKEGTAAFLEKRAPSFKGH